MNALDELFVRYWENDLSEADAAELQRRLATDLAAREAFQFFCLQAVVAAELPLLANTGAEAAEADVMQALRGKRTLFPAGWSRRQVLRYIGGGAAAFALAGLLARQHLGAATGVRVASVAGEVTLRTANGRNIRPAGDIPQGGTLATVGPVSSALLVCPDGTEVSCTGDSEVAVMGQGARLVLQHGTATANIPAHRVGPQSMILQTTQATLARLSNVLMTLARSQRGTEIGVQTGVVAVDSPSGQSLGVVRAGEILTVRADGDRTKQVASATPDEFAWDLSRPLPSGWNVGRREETADGPVVVPQFWLDPYYRVEMCQIRSDHQWARGFFRLHPDSIIRVRYWVDRAGPSQLVICVRKGSHSQPLTGVLECNGAFIRAKPEAWQVLEVRASDMLDTMQAPKFEAPWVGFLVVFNTYRSDIGLKVAGFEVIQPRGKIELL